MARLSPAEKLGRLLTVAEAWRDWSLTRRFNKYTLAQFEQAIQPSLRARDEIAALQSQLR